MRSLCLALFALLASCRRCGAAPIASDAIAPDAAPTDAAPYDWHKRLNLDASHATTDDVDHCYADPFCPEEAAEAMLMDALDFMPLDASVAPVECYRFYYGYGTRTDLALARRCLEAQVIGPCEGHASLDRIFLAVMAIDGQGGPKDPARKTALLTGCSEDIAVEDLATRTAGATPLDPCKGVTLTMFGEWECAQIHERRASWVLASLAKEAFPRFSSAAQASWTKANAAWDAYERAEASELDIFRDGYSYIKNVFETEHIAELGTQRAADLHAMFSYAAPAACAQGDVDAADADLRRALAARMTTGDTCEHAPCQPIPGAEQKSLIAATHRAWEQFRDAEVALYTGARGTPTTNALIACDVKLRLTRKRVRVVAQHTPDAPDASAP